MVVMVRWYPYRRAVDPPISSEPVKVASKAVDKDKVKDEPVRHEVKHKVRRDFIVVTVCVYVFTV